MQTVLIVAVVLIVLYLLFRLFKTLLKWLLIVVVVIVVVAFFSNPDFDAHRKELTTMQKKTNRSLKEKNLTFDDYKIFSLTKKKVNGKEKVVGVGAFGKVWYFDEGK